MVSAIETRSTFPEFITEFISTNISRRTLAPPKKAIYSYRWPYSICFCL